MRRRVDQRRDVGMPTGPLGLCFFRYLRAVAMVIGRGRDSVDLREFRRGGIALVRMARCHLTELGAECDLSGMVERLIAKEDDFPLVQRGTDRSLLVGRQRRGKVAPR